MRSNLRYGTILLAFVGSVGLAAAQQSPTSPLSPTQPQRAPMATKQQAVQLSAEQRSQIYQAVIKDSSHKAAPAGLSARIGAKIPATVELYELPANVAAQVPNVKGFKFVVAQNQVLLVDPASNEIVEIIRQ